MGIIFVHIIILLIHFSNTRRLSNAILSNPAHGVLQTFVNDSWSSTKGSKRLLPGANA